MKSLVPKVLHEICGKPLLAHVLDAASVLKAAKTVVVLSPKRPQVRRILDKKISVALQKEALGTADAVSSAVRDIPSDCRDVMVLYGDTPLIRPQTVRALYQTHAETSASCTVLTTFLNDPRGYGRIVRSDAGHFLAIVEDKDADRTQKAIREVNTGLYCFKKDDLLETLKAVRPDNKSGEYYLTDVLSRLLEAGKKIETSLTEDPAEVLGVNSRKELQEAACVLRFRRLEALMEAGVWIEDPGTTFIDASARIGKETKIFPFTYIEKDVVVGEGCQVGPFCHLRSGAFLENGACVGNFTEVKNSRLREGSVMHHVGYLGDAMVGRNVNIGAGVITANFDGKTKNKTVIKDRAFIGSDAVLVAPVTIGKKAVVGAGSVVTRRHHVPDGGVVAGVPARPFGKSKKHSKNV